jgi:hypothetical protein
MEQDCQAVPYAIICYTRRSTCMPPTHQPACTITIKGDPPPLLLSAELLQVSDFNLSRLMEESQEASSMAAGNPRWLAPEVLEGRGATLAAVSLGLPTSLQRACTLVTVAGAGTLNRSELDANPCAKLF